MASSNVVTCQAPTVLYYRQSELENEDEVRTLLSVSLLILFNTYRLYSELADYIFEPLALARILIVGLCKKKTSFRLYHPAILKPGFHYH